MVTQRADDTSYRDGRDELNLADFPISVLQRQQPVDEHGTKRDSAVFEASRYDPVSRRRVQQRVILETSSRHGLPTPADENVILALLYLAKHTHNFADPVVRFSPRQLFRIMGWAPNSRSYDRLRDVLRRLKALVIRYENAWWDIAGRQYEAEVATGVISEYELGRQVSGPKQGAATPPCWVSWTPHFQQSLRSGNLKKLDLELLFSLRLPTSQRMYRFLDKRFYPPHQPPVVEMDLRDFACGHVGLAAVENVAELKRRLAPAIAELEEIGFLARAEPHERYQKVRPGVWRVRFTAGPRFRQPLPAREAAADRALPAASPPEVVPAPAAEEPARERDLVASFYRLWGFGASHPVGAADLAQARELLAVHGPAQAALLVEQLVAVVKKSWPECRSFSGAAAKYLADAVAACARRQRTTAERVQTRLRQRVDHEEAERLAAERRRLEACWQALTESERQALEDEVLQRYPEHRGRAGIVKDLCLRRLAERGDEALAATAALPLWNSLDG